MQLLTTGLEHQNTFLELIKNRSKICFASAWANSDTQFMISLNNNREKIEYGIIGIHFCQTDPEVLRMFYKFDKIKFILQTSGVFHPKVYLFYDDQSKWDVIIGSLNITKAAFTINKEISIHLTSEDIRSPKEFFDEIYDEIVYMSTQARQLDEKSIKEYEEKYKNNKSVIDGFFPNQQYSNQIRTLDDFLNMNWSDYFNILRNEININHDLTIDAKHYKNIHNLEHRTMILNNARKLFNSNDFDKLEPIEMKALAGFGYVNNGDNLLGCEWGVFGHMKASGIYMNRICNKDPNICKAINLIPLSGEITREIFLDYVNLFMKAFKDGGANIACLTRLLAIKRPDYFICLNEANLIKLNNIFQINGIKRAFSKKRFEIYWDEIICTIQKAKWWSSDKPKDNINYELDAWYGRVALLDAFFCDPHIFCV